jgi:DNA-binding response OmpR family regulator
MTASRADVLIIDDVLVDLRLLMDLMTLRDLRFAVGRDGEHGYQQVLALRPGLILLDVRMPGVDGFMLCRRLKTNPLVRDIPVIFLTAATDIGERLAGFAAGGVDFITKPFDPREVLARVGVHLELASRRANEIANVDPMGVETSTRNIRSDDANPSPDELIVMTAQKLLRNAISTPPSLEELSRLVGVNRRRLNDAFRDFLGQPVYGWFREERLRLGYSAVFETESAISVISDRLGYSTPAHFTKTFRDRYGVTPTELRASRTATSNRGPRG